MFRPVLSIYLSCFRTFMCIYSKKKKKILKVCSQIESNNFLPFAVRRTLKGEMTAEEWETVASYSDAV